MHCRIGSQRNERTESLKPTEFKITGAYRQKVFKRFQKRIQFTDTCWLWTGAVINNGYGQFRVNRKTIVAHRVAYDLYRGNIPKGKLVLHSCDNPPCVNPAHLFLGTQSDNVVDSIKKNRQWQVKKTYCKRGHLLSGKNLRMLSGKGRKDYRDCWQCYHDRNKGLI